MNPNKRPRPAIPLLVHVDNPTEAASVTVDTSAVEGKLNTVISNQERIYEKIPTSTGGGGGGTADMTTVNEKTTALASVAGTTSDSVDANTISGKLARIAGSLGRAGELPGNNSVYAFLNNLKHSVGSSSNEPNINGSSVRDLLAAIKANTASGGGGGGGGGSADLTTVNEKTTALATAIGTADDTSSTVSVIGLLKSITDKY